MKYVNDTGRFSWLFPSYYGKFFFCGPSPTPSVIVIV